MENFNNKQSYVLSIKGGVKGITSALEQLGVFIIAQVRIFQHGVNLKAIGAAVAGLVPIVALFLVVGITFVRKHRGNMSGWIIRRQGRSHWL